MVYAKSQALRFGGLVRRVNWYSASYLAILCGAGLFFRSLAQSSVFGVLYAAHLRAFACIRFLDFVGLLRHASLRNLAVFS